MTVPGHSSGFVEGFDPVRGDEAIVLELTRTDPERVHPRGSRWTALAIAVFTAMTCAGLASQTVVPRLIDRAADRGETAATSVAPVAPPSAVPAFLAAPAPAPAVTVTRAEIARGAPFRVHLAGTATVTVPSLAVTLTVGGRAVGTARVIVAADATIADDTAAVGRALWLVDVPVSSTVAGESHDAVAVAEIRWPSSSAGPPGSVTSFISIGDGRNAP